MSHLNIKHAGGVGDGIMFSPIVKDYSKKYNTVSVIPDSLLCKDIFSLIYANYPNIKFNFVENAPTIRVEFKDAVDNNGWRTLDWAQNEELENRIYEEIVCKFGKTYLVIHEREIDNCGRKLQLLNRKHFLSNIPCINLDATWLKNNGITPYNILHYRKTINNATQAHFYEGSFMNFTDSLSIKNMQLFAHLYCKPHLFDKNMVHNQIIGFIQQNKWHKNRWTYIYEN